MFVPVSCTACGKPFQVPEAALGKTAACPWCQAVVTALPVAAVTEPATSPPPPAPAPRAPKSMVVVAKPSAPAPLSLDDEPAPRPRARVRPAPAPGAGWRGMFSPLVVAAAVAVSVVALVLTVAALGYNSGRVTEGGWSEFTPPDGSCSILLPDRPSEQATEPNPGGSVGGGKRFAVVGWYTGTSAWLAWSDLDPGFAASAAKDKDKVFTASAIQAELNREKERLGGTVTKEAEIRFQSAWGVEVQMDTPKGKVVERLILVADGPRPRLYVYGVRAKNVAHNSTVVTRMFASFKVNE